MSLIYESWADDGKPSAWVRENWLRVTTLKEDATKIEDFIASSKKDPRITLITKCRTGKHIDERIIWER